MRPRSLGLEQGNNGKVPLLRRKRTLPPACGLVIKSFGNMFSQQFQNEMTLELLYYLLSVDFQILYDMQVCLQQQIQIQKGVAFHINNMVLFLLLYQIILIVHVCKISCLNIRYLQIILSLLQ